MIFFISELLDMENNNMDDMDDVKLRYACTADFRP